jgi:hypothetical protein
LPDTCIIDFTVDILKAPTIDALPATPGLQTGNIAGADGMTTDGSVGNSYQTNTTTILAAPLTATTVASSSSPFTSFSDSVTLGGVPAGSPAPTGTVTFLAYGPNDPTCADATPMTDGPRALTGLTTSSGAFDPPGPGDYTFRVTYSGDANYQGFTTACGEPNETITIPAPQIQVVKTASPLTRVQPGGTFTFQVVVSNPSPNVPIAITSLTDDIYGNIGTSTAASNTCDDLIGDVLAPGASSAPCSFDGTFTGAAGASQTDIVSVLGTDANGFTATDTDDAVVTLTPPPPAGATPVIAVTKAASPATRPVPGGDFTFTVTVSNPSASVPIRITALTDDVYGNLATIAGSTCGSLIGVTLAPGATSAPCSFPGRFTGAAGARQTDTVTVTGVDSNGNTTSATAQATVGITAAPASPPPAQAVAAVSASPGSARISGPTGCVPRPFSVLVTGRKIRRVTFYLDGRRVRSLTRPNSGTRYLLRVRPGSLSRGAHRVLAVTSFTAASGTRQRTLRLVFQRCAQQAVAPRFTA